MQQAFRAAQRSKLSSFDIKLDQINFPELQLIHHVVQSPDRNALYQLRPPIYLEQRWKADVLGAVCERTDHAIHGEVALFGTERKRQDDDVR